MASDDDSTPSLDLKTSYWCRNCNAYLFTAPNKWRSISSRAVVHFNPSHRSGDIENNMLAFGDEMNGGKKLKGCVLRNLFCKTCTPNGPSDDSTVGKVGIKCIRGTREKRYSNDVFIYVQDVVIRRGRSFPDENFIIRDEPASAPKPLNEPPPRSTPRPKPAPETVSQAEVESSAFQSFPASPEPEQSITELGSIPSQPVAIRPSPSDAPSSQKPIAKASHNSRQGQPEPSASSNSAAKFAPKSNPTRQAMSWGPDDSEDSDDATGMIQPRVQNEPTRDELAVKVDDQANQLQKQGLLIDKQFAEIETQSRTIVTLYENVTSLEAKLKSYQEQVSRQFAELRQQLNADSPSAPLSSTSARPASKRSYGQINSVDQMQRDLETSAARPSVLDKIRNPAGDRGAVDDSQATREYLRKTVREDNSEDEDYSPGQEQDSMQAAAGRQRAPQVNSRPATAHHIEESSSHARTSVQDSIEDGLDLANVPRSVFAPDAAMLESPGLPSTPNGRGGSIIRRGVSGGRNKPTAPALTHRAFASNANASMTSTPTSFEPGPKRPRVESALGSGSFKGGAAAAPTANSGQLLRRRDSEGYLLKANGKRDLRSIRGKTLGNQAFRPSNGHRVTVDSLMAAGMMPRSVANSPDGAATTPTTGYVQQASSVVSTPTVPQPFKVSPAGRVTTIADAQAAQKQPDKRIDFAKEAEKEQRRRLGELFGKGAQNGKQYSDRHAEFMSKLGIMD